MPPSPTLVCSAHGAHAHLRLHVSVSSACQRHLVQNVLVWRLLSGRNTQICSWRPTLPHSHCHARTKALNSCNLDKGNNNVNAVCNKATIMHLLSRSLIGDDKSCFRLVALVPFCVWMSSVSLASVRCDTLNLLYFSSRKPADLQNLAPGTHPPFITFNGEVKTDVNKIEEFLEDVLCPPKCVLSHLRCRISHDSTQSFSVCETNPSQSSSSCYSDLPVEEELHKECATVCKQCSSWLVWSLLFFCLQGTSSSAQDTQSQTQLAWTSLQSFRHTSRTPNQTATRVCHRFSWQIQ